MDMAPSVSFPFPVIMAINNVPGASQMFYCSLEKENSITNPLLDCLTGVSVEWSDSKRTAAVCEDVAPSNKY